MLGADTKTGRQDLIIRRLDPAYGLVIVVAMLVAATCATGSEPRSTLAPLGSLVVQADGFVHDNGQAVARLFRRKDQVPTGKPYRIVPGNISAGRATLIFKDLPYGSYALVVVHDENANGRVDHNLFNIPSEKLGFSNGFSVSLFSGVPDFNDLRFSFNPTDGPLKITVE